MGRARFGSPEWAERWRAKREALCICEHEKYLHTGFKRIGHCQKRGCKCRRFKFADPALRGCLVCREHSLQADVEKGK